MDIILIAAVAANGVIGRSGVIPWHVPGELAFFKQTTMGWPLIMGRKTWQSLGRPLPGRRNIVLTRNAAFAAPGAEIEHTLEEAITAAGEEAEKIFVIGGEQIYRLALPQADALILSRLAQAFPGDAFFPSFNCPPFQLAAAEQINNGPIPYRIETYRRASATASP